MDGEGWRKGRRGLQVSPFATTPTALLPSNTTLSTGAFVTMVRFAGGSDKKAVLAVLRMLWRAVDGTTPIPRGLPELMSKFGFMPMACTADCKFSSMLHSQPLANSICTGPSTPWSSFLGPMNLLNGSSMSVSYASILS